MSKNVSRPLQMLCSVWRAICILIAIALSIYCFYEFSKDEDTTSISYKTFNQDEYSAYPQIEVCIPDFSYEKTQFAKQQNNMSNGDEETEYQKDVKLKSIYLGKEWDDRLKTIDMNGIHATIKDYVIDTCIYGPEDINPERKCDGKGVIETYVATRGKKCFTMHYTQQKLVEFASIWINMPKIVTEHKKAKKWSFFRRIRWKLSFPFQTLNPRGRQGTISNNANNVYSFELSHVEMNKHRNRTNSICHEWKRYDALELERILSFVGCRPFYVTNRTLQWLNITKKYSPCQNQTSLKPFAKRVDSKSAHQKGLPCFEVSKLVAGISQQRLSIKEEEEEYPSIIGKLDNITNWKRITLYFNENEFKLIEQVRAYTVQGLIGNAGGFVGLFIGCALYDLPSLLTLKINIIHALFSCKNN